MISGEQFQQSLIPVPTKPSAYRGEKVLVSTTRSGEHISRKDWGLSSLSERPATQSPPSGYYAQQHGQQGVLPGMEMSPQTHVALLGKKHDMHAELVDAGEYHSIQFRAHEREPDSSPLTNLSWTKKDTPTEEEGYGMHPGEIGMVHVHAGLRDEGMASDMLKTAETIALEHPDFAMPKHSEKRSDAGVKWSQKKMKERGEEVW